MTLSGLGFCSWDWGVLGCWVVEGAWRGERIFSSMWKHTCTQTHTKHFPLNTPPLPTSQSLCTVTFGSHLICAAPLVPLPRILYCLAEAPFKRAHASLSSLSILALFLSTSPAFPAFTLILCLHFSIIIFFRYYFSLSFSLCLFFWHFLLPWLKHALYLYLSSRSIPACVFFFFFFLFLPSGCFIPFSLSDPPFHALFSPESWLVFK